MFVDSKLTQEETQNLLAPFQIDLTAYYRVLNEVVINQLTESVRNGLTPDEAIIEIEKIFE